MLERLLKILLGNFTRIQLKLSIAISLDSFMKYRAKFLKRKLTLLRYQSHLLKCQKFIKYRKRLICINFASLPWALAILCFIAACNFFFSAASLSFLVMGWYKNLWMELITWVPTRVNLPKLRQSTTRIVRGGQYISCSGSSKSRTGI